MLTKTFCFFAALGLVLGGCAAETTSEEERVVDETTTAVDGAEAVDTDETLDLEGAGEEMYDQLHCNKTCVLECGDCSCCL